MSAAVVEQVIPFQIHEKFLPLLTVPHTFADIHGGRYGMKSETVHRIALKRAMEEPIRILGARETMASIEDSSHKTLSDIIYQHQMSTGQNGPFEIQKKKIIRMDGERIASEFIFVGVRENVRDKKSLAKINLMIFDEAGKCSEDSLNVFVPTVIREPGCKAWFIWNPELVIDPIYKMMVLNTPTNTLKIETSYLDNPWLSDEARQLVEDCRKQFPKKYRHLYLGEPATDVEGAIYGEEMKKCEEEGRICDVPYDRTKPVHTAWDLGFGDPTCIWFVQAVGTHLHFIDYLSDSQKDISSYVIELNQRGYVYGTDWLPHDAVDNIIHKRLMGGGDPSQTIPNLMRAAGRKVDSSPKLLNTDSMNIARSVFPICRFDAKKCAAGIHGLRHYQWDRTELEEGKRKPLHDFASHPATAFWTAAVSIKPNASQGYMPKAGPRRMVAEI